MEPLLNRLYVFFIRNDIWIYILSSIGLIWYLMEFLRAQSRLRRTMFGLERETALRSRNAALLFVLLLGSLIAVVTYVNIVVRPTLPPSLLSLPTPTPDPAALPAVEGAGTSTAPPVSPTSPLPVAPTVTLPGGVAPATETISTTRPATAATGTRPAFLEPTPPIAGCTPRATITDPRPGAVTDGPVNVSGTADTEDFAYYELEINGPQTNGRWADLLGRRIDNRVNLGFLGGNISLSRWEPGNYLIRLKVVNQEGDITHQCVVNIELVQ